ncbi:hypothetical protein K7G91_000896 [Pasteurella canis]|uniref:hypothetical protein n=1 Tax=Pasteurella canis TaxID=753 RepID=UPI001D122339|nr:hypothetical protein [Pasteurella canis]UDW84610.1 hypothetical protein K7G91_000896 [Pasteurella canis]
MTLTKDQILTHMLGINLFRTRDNNIVRVTFYDTDPSDSNYPINVTCLTGEDRGDNYHVTAEGSNYASEEESEYDLVALITADDLQQLTKPDKQPTSKPEFNIDLKQCMEDQTYLKTRDGKKVLVVLYNPHHAFAFSGVIVLCNGFIDTATWTETGHYSGKGIKHDYDIVGLWEEDDE